MNAAKPSYIFLILILVFSLGSCSNTRFLTANENLYTGRGKIDVTAPNNCRNLKDAKQLINDVTSVKPNNSVAGKRLLPPFGLWIHNYMKPKGKGKLASWFYRTFSKEPVLVSSVNPELRSQKLKSELFNIGFFHSNVQAQVVTNEHNPRKAKINYKISLDHPFEYDSISFTPPVDALDSLINSREPDFKIKAGDVFDISILKAEANKITSIAVEKGYYYFKDSYLQWLADTTKTPGKINLKIGINRTIMPHKAAFLYSIDKLSVRVLHPKDSIGIQFKADSITYKGIKMVNLRTKFKPELISRSIYFKSGDIYSASAHQKTMQRLNSYGIFKYINLQFIPGSDSLAHQLDLKLDLTPMQEVSLDLETNIVTKSTGFSGPGFVVTLSHRNIARAANQLQFKLHGGLEWQLGAKTTSTLGTTSYNAGFSSSLVFPKIIRVVNLFNGKKLILPQTTITAGFEFLNKIRYYRMNSINLGFGYQFRTSDKVSHNFYPLYLNSITLMKTTDVFDSILNTNRYIRKSFEEQFIAGMKYDFIFDNNSSKKLNGLYFQGGISTAGNLIDLLKNWSAGNEERPYMTIGNVYSQFIKLTSEFRYYRNRENHSLVLRLYAGIGVPYKNSVVMPYVEQFYSGGSNSIRAFIARSLGPGSYHEDVSSDIIDQTGDIRLEGNMEYRFRISGVVHGALFLDAGNVWLLNRDENRPGSQFKSGTFIDQLAVGTGVGLRFDFNFFILRTDLGLPLRKAYPTDGNNWLPTVKDVMKGYVFNLAIGYPF